MIDTLLDTSDFSGSHCILSAHSSLSLELRRTAHIHCIAYFSMTVIKHHSQKQPGKGRVYFTLHFPATLHP